MKSEITRLTLNTLDPENERHSSESRVWAIEVRELYQSCEASEDTMPLWHDAVRCSAPLTKDEAHILADALGAYSLWPVGELDEDEFAKACDLFPTVNYVDYACSCDKDDMLSCVFSGLIKVIQDRVAPMLPYLS